MGGSSEEKWHQRLIKWVKKKNVIWNRKQFGVDFWLILLLFGAFVFGLVYWVPAWITQNQWRGLNFTQTGQIGDTIGGIIGPGIAIIASILTFIAFWVQFKANQQQKRDLQIERFESRLFSMLETHRNNVTEIMVHNPVWIETIDSDGKKSRISHVEIVTGRAAFLRMFAELKEIFKHVKDFHEGEDYSKQGGKNVGEELVFETAYLLFFFGLDKETEAISKNFWPDGGNPLFLPAIENLKKIKEIQSNSGQEIAINKLFGSFNSAHLSWNTTINREYQIGRGHSESLSHYFRQIFQMVNFIDSNNCDWIGKSERDQYARLIRSQLSTYEQLMLYYNAISAMGRPWIKKDLLKKYPLVRSLPLPLADFHWKPIEILGGDVGDENFVFDWLEIKERYRTNDFTTPPQG